MVSRPDAERESTGALAHRVHRFDPPVRELPGSVDRALRAVCEAMMTDEGEDGALVPPPEATLDRSLDWVRGALSATTSGLAPAFYLLVFAVEFLPIFVLGRLSRMSRLPLAERIEYLETLERHPSGWLALLFTAIKVPITIPAFEAGPELRETGFDRPTLASRRVLPVAQSGGSA